MAVVVISQAGALTSLGMLTDNANPPKTIFENRNGPTWQQDLPPGSYVFTCDFEASAGATVTITVTGAAAASKAKKLGGIPGQQVADSIDLRFTVIGSSFSLQAGFAPSGLVKQTKMGKKRSGGASKKAKSSAKKTQGAKKRSKPKKSAKLPKKAKRITKTKASRKKAGAARKRAVPTRRK
jgi:hypothetical protein